MSNDKIKNNTNNTSCLLSHIVVGLSVIVFYKLAKHFKISDKLNKTYNIRNNTENFTESITDSINNFVTGANTEIIDSQQASTLSPTQLSLYSNKLDSLMANITNLQNSINTPPQLDNTNPANLSTLDLTAQQQYQMFQIEYLNKQISNAKDVINAQSISDSSTNYKPIKVFSSCIVSNANGSTTKETPVNGSRSSLGDLQSSDGSQSANSQQMLNTISQSNSQTNGPLLSPNAGVFQYMFTNLPNFNGININQ